MTIQEAFDFLGIDQPDEVEDAFEERLFELKHYFLTKPVLSKLYSAQLKKVDRLFEVAGHLKIELVANVKASKLSPVQFQGEIVKDFLAYEEARAQFKSLLVQVNEHDGITQLVHQLLAIQKDYLAQWPENSDQHSVIGKEPDPMELLTAIKEMYKNGMIRFDQLAESSIALPPAFLNEWKRLSLLSKKEVEWKMSSQS